MTRPNDCIYCSKTAGSAEHVFPAALGGRRKNKGILCRACNEGFSDLDRNLAGQLQYLRGVLGVRPDHRDAPVPAAVPLGDRTLLIDAEGRPSFKEPRTLVDEPLENGHRRVRIEFASRRQADEWRAEQKRKGLTLTNTTVTQVGRVMTEPVPVDWKFGGPETFREAARIALNFLAHRFPGAARNPRLRPLKEYVLGVRDLAAGEARPVWFLDGEVCVPTSTVELGHQVFVRLDRERGRGYAIVRFFDAVELLVDFGSIDSAETVAVLFDIDPHVDHQPGDLVERRLPPEEFPAAVDMLRVGDEAEARLGNPERFARALDAITERQSRRRLAPLAAELARIRATDPADWVDAIHDALGDHEGPIYRLIAHVAKSFAAHFAGTPEMEPYAAVLAAIAEPDPAQPSGLTPRAREAVQFARMDLAAALADELAAGEITIDRLLLLLEGGPGAHVVAQSFITEIRHAIARVAAPSPAPGP